MIKDYGIIQSDFHQSYQNHPTSGLVMLEGTTKENNFETIIQVLTFVKALFLPFLIPFVF